MYRLGCNDSLDFFAFAVTYDDTVGRKAGHMKSAQGDDAEKSVILHVLDHKAAFIGMRIQHKHRAVSLCVRHRRIYIIHRVVS